ncbi:hypothetical protein SAY86_022669 [Trapa natans]|uniref:Uncharacterized protein n=1 Tax=Trapa natans TaxID=22666 RepID=A0AAN7LUP6_TRANT|nr:hypothetical protein SAY86_022669 [Trapa natans]
MMVSQAISCSLCGLPAVPKNRGFALRAPPGASATPQYSFRFCDRSTQHLTLRSLRTSRCFLLDVVVRSSFDPVGHLPPPGASPGSWTWWILGAVVAVVLPFTKSRWGPLLKLKNEVETVVEMAEEVTEVVEKVAEDVAELLPQGGKLRDTVELVEHVAEVTAKDAHMVKGFIEKLEELEKEVEGGMESILERPAPKLLAASDNVAAKGADEPAPDLPAPYDNGVEDEVDEPAGSV